MLNNFLKNKIKGQKAPYIFISIIFILIIIIFLLLSIKKDYVVLSSKSGDILAILPYKSDEFRVEFRHSVNKGMVIENYRIDFEKNKFYLYKAEFESYGAGMLDEVDETMKFYTNDKMQVVEFSENWIDSVSYLPAGIARHIFYYGDNEIDFYKNWGSEGIRISILDLNFLQSARRYYG